jgi:DNA-binding NtrC family response regulator
VSSGEESDLRLSSEAVDALNAYHFPGNVRELENAMTRASALCLSGLITLDCLPPNISAVHNVSAPDQDASALVADRPTMAKLERRYLELVLTEVNGNRRRAAKILGVNRRTIQRLIARYNLIALAEMEIRSAAEDDPDSDGSAEETLV